MVFVVRYYLNIWNHLFIRYKEPECCDGSDELPGICVNRCKEVGEEYRKKRDAERKIQKTVRSCPQIPDLSLSLNTGSKNTFHLYHVCAQGEETPGGSRRKYQPVDCGSGEGSCSTQRSLRLVVVKMSCPLTVERRHRRPD